MKYLFFILIIISAIFISCAKEPTEVIVSDENQDAVYRIGSESGILGNVDLHLIPNTIQGSAIILLNGPGSHVGYDIRKRDDYSYIYFADSYISAGGYSLQAGTNLPLDVWLRVRLVIYKSGLSGYVVSFLKLLGLDFFDQVEDYMIEKVYEADVYLSSNSNQGVKISGWRQATRKYKNNF